MKTVSCAAAEILESRIAPAGVVTTMYDAATGELTLTGDPAANTVSVFQTGPNSYRIEGAATDIDTPGTSFREIGKLTKLTILGDGDVDTFHLLNLRTLTALSFSGGDGDDLLDATNLAVKGAVDLHAEGGGDTVAFKGVTTFIGGNLNGDCGPGATDGISISLEARTTSIGGQVKITGGAAASGIQAIADGTLKIGKGVNFTAGSGGGTVALSNDGLLSIGKLTTGESILFTGDVGDDSLSFGGFDVKLAGGIQMTGDVGSDTIDFFNPTGKVKVGKLKTGASIFFDGGDDDDAISLVASRSTLEGAIDFVGGDGLNDLALGADGGTIKIGKLKTGESIRFTGGDDANTIFVLSSSLTLAGGIDFTEGFGDHVIQLLAGSGKVVIGKMATGHSIRIVGLTGGDGIGALVASLTLAGGIEIDGGDGSNGMSLGNPDSIVKIGKLATGQSMLINGGVDDDTVTADVARLTLAGGVEFTDAGGANAVEFDNGGVVKIGRLAGGQSLALSGGGDAGFAVNLGGFTTLAGSLEVLVGTGPAEVDFDGMVSVGKNAAGTAVQVSGGPAIDFLDFEDTVVLAGGLNFTGGGNGDTLDLTAVNLLVVKGDLFFNAGPGDDIFDLDASALSVGGNLGFRGGDDLDKVSLSADGVIGGDVELDLGGAAAAGQSIMVRSTTGFPGGLFIKGMLTATSTSGVGFDDDLTLTNVAVAKLVDLKMGDGISLVTIDNLLAGDELKLTTGAGADVVAFERGNFFGNSVVAKLATIQLGADDDQLLIGNPLPVFDPLFPDPSRVNFLGGLNAQGGGEANDNRNDIVGQNTGVVLGGLTGFAFATLV